MSAAGPLPKRSLPLGGDGAQRKGAPPVSLERRSAVTVRTAGRLHLGFLDPSASLGRAFGSLGLVIDGPATEVELSVAPGSDVLVAAPSAPAETERAKRHLQRLREHTGLMQALNLRVLQALPAHAGFGSGTQLALAVGTAFARLHRLEVDTATMAQWLGRGLRSGIGIAAFDHGGLLLDGGPSADGTPAPLLSRIDLPAAWRVVLVQEVQRGGLSGREEKEAIARLPDLPRAAAADLCHQVLMRVLSGAACGDFEAFAAGINRVQQVLGAHFAPAQGGSAFASAAVERLVRWFGAAQLNEAAIGQSSWGPTGFAIVPSQASARALVDAAEAAGAIDPALSVTIVAARNEGATVIDSREHRRRA